MIWPLQFDKTRSRNSFRHVAAGSEFDRQITPAMQKQRRDADRGENVPNVDFGVHCADSDEAGHAFRQEAGHRFRFEAGRGSDLMSATWRLLPRIDVMMFCPERLVKRAWIWISAKARVAVGNGGRSALSIAP